MFAKPRAAPKPPSDAAAHHRRQPRGLTKPAAKRDEMSSLSSEEVVVFLQKAAVARDMPAIQRGLSGSLQDARTLVILREFPDCRPRSSPSADAIYASINMAPPPVSTEHRQAPTLEGAAWGKNAPRDSGTLYLVNPHSLRLSFSHCFLTSPLLSVCTHRSRRSDWS